MLKRLAIGGAVLGGVGVLVAFRIWSQLTALPEWYDPRMEPSGSLDEAAPSAWRPIASRPDAVASELDPPAKDPEGSATPSDPVASREGAPSPRQMVGFHRNIPEGPATAAIRASRAVFEGDRLEAGVVLDVSRLDTSAWTAHDRELYERARSGFRALTRRNVYIGIEDRPISEDGVLRLGAAPMVRVGNVRYSIASAARKLGMSPERLRAEFDLAMKQLALPDPRLNPPR